MKKMIMIALFAIGMVLGTGITAYAVPARMEDGTLFDSDYYVESNPDLMPVFGRDTKKLYQHYVTCGKAEGREPLSPKYVYPELPAPAGETYTIEELAAIYRNIIEVNGYTWDPSLKGNWSETIGQYPLEEWYLHDDEYTGGSWGTGFLEPGNIERNAYSELEALAFTDGTNHKRTSYYFEVLGWSESMGMIEFVAW